MQSWWLQDTTGQPDNQTSSRVRHQGLPTRLDLKWVHRLTGSALHKELQEAQAARPHGCNLEHAGFHCRADRSTQIGTGARKLAPCSELNNGRLERTRGSILISCCACLAMAAIILSRKVLLYSVCLAD